ALIQEVDEPVAEDAIVFSMTERHVRDRAMSDRDFQAELCSGESDCRLRYLDPSDGHSTIEKRTRASAVAHGRDKDVLDVLSSEVVAGEKCRSGWLEAPRRLHLCERGFPEFGHRNGAPSMRLNEQGWCAPPAS